MARAIVQVRNLFKSFVRGSEEIKVLQDLSLDVGEAEFLTLMGPSGSGKTTLLNLIAGLDQPTAGTILVGDHTISGMSESQLARWRTRNVGFIFQFYYLLPVLTAFENVELPLLLLTMSSRQRREQVLKALDLVALTDRMRHRPGQLSGGQQQRVGIARAIVTDPTLIVADEPTGELDETTEAQVLAVLQSCSGAQMGMPSITLHSLTDPNLRADSPDRTPLAPARRRRNPPAAWPRSFLSATRSPSATVSSSDRRWSSMSWSCSAG